MYIYIYTCIYIYTYCMYVRMWCDLMWCDLMWCDVTTPWWASISVRDPFMLGFWRGTSTLVDEFHGFVGSGVFESSLLPFILTSFRENLDEWISCYWDPCFWEGLLWLGWLSPDSAEDYKENLERIKKGGKADSKADNQRHQSEQWPLDHHLSSNHHLCHTTWFIGNDELTNNANQYQAVYIKGCLSVLNMSWFSM